MRPETKEIPEMVENLLRPYNGLVLELVEQTAKANYYRDCLDGGAEQVDYDPFGDIEPTTRKEWIYRHNYLLGAIEYLEDEGYIKNCRELIEEDD